MRYEITQCMGSIYPAIELISPTRLGQINNPTSGLHGKTQQLGQNNQRVFCPIVTQRLG